MSSKQLQNKIAIVGMAGRFPGAENLAQFWRNLTDKKCSITAFDAADAQAAGIDPQIANQSNYVGASGVLQNASAFDPEFFHYTEAEAELIDPQQRMFLQTCWHALEDAGYAPSQIKQRVGLFAGSGYSTYLLDSMANDRRQGATAGSFRHLMGNDKDYLTTRVSYKLNLTGPSLSVNTACSTSLVAVHLACQSVLSGESDMAMAGGVKINSPQLLGHLWQEGAPFSHDASCRPFSDQAAGTPAGNGVGVVVLKRLENAIEDGDHIYSVILSSAVNNDGGEKVGYTAPSRHGQTQVIAEAMALADIEPESIGYIETHGTATELGDALEFAALNDIFSSANKAAGSDKKAYCALGGVKANIGHLDSAAGIASLIKASLALHHNDIPAGLYGRKTGEQLDFDGSAFYLSDQTEAWRTPRDLPRRAGVSSFGVGGTNAHIILQQAPELVSESALIKLKPNQLPITFSAQSGEQLASLIGDYEVFIQQHPQLSLADICFTNATGRCHFDYRCAFIASSLSDFSEQLKQWLKQERWREINPCRSQQESQSVDLHDSDLQNFETLVNAYLAGENLPWGEILQSLEAKRVALPAYPFKQTSLYLGQGIDTDLILANKKLWSQLVDTAASVAETEKSLLQLDNFHHIKSDLELLSAAYVAEALKQLGAFSEGNERMSAEALMQNFQIKDDYLQLMQRLLDGLAEQGFIQQDNQGYWDVEPMAESEMSGLLKRHQQNWQGFPAMETTFPQLGDNLAAILQGKLDAREIYFAKGDLSTALNIYEDLATSRYYNTILRSLVHSSVATTTKQGRPPLRILELGAGTGATAARVLQGMPGTIAEYMFTDVSTLFLQQAEQRFAEFDFMSYQLFDMNKPAEQQGLQLQHYDLIIAANVVHVTQAIAPVMRNLHGLLKPQGILALYEITENSLHGDITTSLLLPPVKDNDLRGNAPFMSPKQWHQVARETGFLRADSWPTDESDATITGEHVLLYQAGPAFEQAAQQRLTNSITSSLLTPVEKNAADGMNEEKMTEIEAFLYHRDWQPLPETQQIITESWAYFIVIPSIVKPEEQLPAAQQSLLEQLQQQDNIRSTSFVLEQGSSNNSNSSHTEVTDEMFAALSNFAATEKICLLWFLGDIAVTPMNDGQTIQNQAMQSCQGLLNLVGLVAETDCPVISKSLLIGSHAYQVEQHQVQQQPVASLLEGFAQVIHRGHPELNLQYVDLNDEQAPAIQMLLNSNPQEQHLAWYQQQLYAARLIQSVVDKHDQHKNAQDKSGQDKNDSDKPDGINIRQGGVYLIIGGSSGIGLAVAQHWANKGAAIIILASRNPNKKAAIELQQTLRQQGCELRLQVVDVSKRQQVQNCIKTILQQNEGRLHGVVHSAVVGDWDDVAQSTEQRLQKIFNPKVAGAWNLHLATSELVPELDFMLLFSSAVTIAPVVGLPDYVAANQFCEALAVYRSQQSQPSLAVAWGSWLSTGAIADDPLRERLQKAGLRPLEKQEALLLLDQAMQFAKEQPVVGALAMDWQQQLRQYSGNIPGFYEQLITEDINESGSSSILSELAQMSAADRNQHLKSYLRDRLARLLRLKAADIGDDANLIQLGLDSLMFLEVASVIGRDLAIKITPKSLYEHFNIQAMSEHFLPQLDLENITTEQSRATESTEDFGQYLKIEPQHMFEPFALTDMQHAYWIGRSADIELGNIAAHGYIELEGSGWDITGLQQAWRTVVARHPMLRAVVNPDGQQQILEHVPEYNFHIENLRELADPQARILTIREEMSHQIRDTACWPLFDIRITLQPADKMRLHFSLDNIVVDGRSLNIFLGEWVHYYLSPEKKLRLAELSFRDYVNAERRYHRSEAYQQRWQYWEERLAQLPAAPALPLATSPDNIVKPSFCRHGLRLEHEQWERLKSRVQSRGLTLASLLLSCYAEVLACWSNNRSFTLNLPTFNRLPVHESVNNVIGEFTSILLVEVSPPEQSTFLERARHLQQQMLTDIDQGGYVSGIEILRHIGRQTGNTRRAQMPVVFSSMFGLEKKEAEFDYDFSAIELFGEQKYAISQTPQVWLDNHIHESSDGLNIYWDEVEGLFPKGLVADMFACYCSLLTDLAQSNTIWDSATVLQLPARQLQAWQQYNVPETAVKTNSTALHLHLPFQQQAQATPEATAIVYGDTQMSYAELQARATGIASLLRLFEASPNQLVAIVMEKGWQQLVASLAILEAGAAYVPIDANQPRQRIQQLLQQTDCRIVLIQSHLADHLQLSSDYITFEVDQQEPATDTSSLQPIQKTDDLAYVIFTSGSTGTPKGVMIDHQGAINTLQDINQRFEVSASDSVLAISALNFDLSVYDIFGVLAAGGTVVIPEAGYERDPIYWAQQMIKHRVTLWNSVPILLQMLLEGASKSQLEKMSIRQILLSGDWIPLTLPQQVEQCWPNARLCSLGGATEASVWSIFHEVNQVDSSWKSIPYGKPLTNQQMHVLDDNGLPCPEWVAGQLYIGGTGLAKGYWKDEEKSRNRFIKHPQTEEKLYKTGDLARLHPAGWLEFLGRNDFQVKIRGHRIEPGEIEAVLRQQPGVQDALVLATGEARARSGLQAYLIAKTGDTFLFEQHAIDPALLKPQWLALNNAIATTQIMGSALPDAKAIDHCWQLLETVFAHTAALALQQLLENYYDDGIDGTDNVKGITTETLSLQSLISQTGVIPRYTHWMRRTIKLLLRHEYLSQVDSQTDGEGIEPLFRVAQLPTTMQQSFTQQSLWQDAKQQLSATLGYSDAVISQIEATLTGLANLLTEEGGASSLYLTDATESIYQHQFHNTHRQLLAAIESHLSAKLDGNKQSNKQTTDKLTGQPIRIIEVGAGLGTATTELLPYLAELSQHQPVEYWFTDVSQLFFSQAKQHFADYGFLQFQLYDIDRPGQWQGIPQHHFDLVIASSVLHVAADLSSTMQDLLKCLAPGGNLLAIEETRYHPWVDIGMGLQPGFERFTDHDLRPDHPLLSKAQWIELCQREGFVQACCHVATGSWEAELGIALLIAQAPASVSRFNDKSLDQTLRAALPEYMVPDHIIPLEKWPLGATGKLDRKQLPLLETNLQRQEYAAPISENEKCLAEIWQQLLGVEKISRNDNFFESGGDSLIATRLNVQLNELGLHLPLGQIFQEPVLYKQAALLQTVDDSSGILKLNDVEAGVPLLWFHAADGEVAVYQKLVSRLSLQQPCYGVRQDGRIQPPTIQRLVAHYVSAITADWPKGEIQLAGFSFGGMLAYLVAEQLCARGYIVTNLLLIDSQFVKDDSLVLEQQDWVQAYAKVYGLNRSTRRLETLATAMQCSVEEMSIKLDNFKKQISSIPTRPFLKLNIPISYVQIKGDFGADNTQIELWQQASQLPLRQKAIDCNHFDCFTKGLNQLTTVVQAMLHDEVQLHDEVDTSRQTEELN